MTFDIDAREFTRAADGLEFADDIADVVLAETLDDLGADALTEVRRRAGRHVRTGRMVDQVTERSTGSGIGTIVRVHAGGSIVPIIVGGSRAHDIAPVRSRALAIGSRAGGSVRSFAARVHHPGTRADPFVADAGDQTADLADRELAIAGDAIAGRIADTIGGT